MAYPSRFGEAEGKLKAMHKAGYPGGVVVDPVPITAGEEVTILYNGLLGTEGKGQVYLRYGFGEHGKWRNVLETRMKKTGWGWVTSTRMPENEDRFNFCFRDSSQNWDNNNGINWSFEVHNGSPNY